MGVAKHKISNASVPVNCGWARGASGVCAKWPPLLATTIMKTRSHVIGFFSLIKQLRTVYIIPY